MNNLDHFIYYDKIYESEKIEKLIEYIPSITWQKKLDETANKEKHISRKGNRNITDDFPNYNLDHNYALFKYFSNMSPFYRDYLIQLFGSRYYSESKITKYDVHDEYYWHVDCYNKKDSVRLISSITYLNDDYDGGETEFLGKIITPKKGFTLVFPSTWMFPHKGNPVKFGVKYIYVCHHWVYTED